MQCIFGSFVVNCTYSKHVEQGCRQDSPRKGANSSCEALFVSSTIFLSSQKLRDLIAKMGEDSPSNFLADFLFSSLTYATYLGVLENI